MKIKNICIITAGYPSEKRMNYTFVYGGYAYLKNEKFGKYLKEKI